MGILFKKLRAMDKDIPLSTNEEFGAFSNALSIYIDCGGFCPI